MLRSRYNHDARERSNRSPGPVPVGAKRLALAAVALAIVVATIPGGSVDAQSGNARAQRDAIRQQKATTAAELNTLEAEDAVLEAAVAELNANVAAQEARVADARRATADARAAADRLAEEVKATERRVGVLEQLLRDRAVESYISQGLGQGTAGEALLDASNPTDLELRKVLIETVQGSDRDAIDQLSLARQQLDRQREDVAIAITEAERLEAETQAQLNELDAARAEQQRVKDALDARINKVQTEVAALAAEEANLSAIIAAAAAASAGPSGGNAAANVERPASAAGLIWPTSGPVTSGFGMRWGAMHAGLDIAPPYGTGVYAANGGTVILAGGQGGYGNLILVDHGGGFVTAYAHLSGFAVGVGQSVNRGELIGYVGSTGDSTGPHLHFETRVGGAAQNPYSFLP